MRSPVSRLWMCLCVGLCLTLSGCLTPQVLEPSAQDAPALKAIRARYEQVVNEARDCPDINWHASWSGNMFVNALKGRHRGLCYQWQDLVYRGVAPTVQANAWHVTGLVANKGNTYEHHVVLVWDPKKITKERILTAPRPRPVYVLDAWHEAKPYIHWLDVWLDNERPHRVPPELQELPAEYVDPSDPAGGADAEDSRFEAPLPNRR